MLESLSSIGSVLFFIGAVALYLTAWIVTYKLLIEEINDLEYVHAAVFAALLVAYTGAGILLIGRVT